MHPLPSPAHAPGPVALPLPPADAGGPGLPTDGRETALDVVLRRMHSTNDFPALSRAITRIQRIAASDTESVASLSAEILKDVALTHKLLRMVNTVHYRGAGGGGATKGLGGDSVSTVSRAVALVGFAGIRNMALSLVLLEGLANRAQAARLREEFVVSLVASQMASSLTPWDTDAEEAYLAALFHNLGRMLAEFYLPDEARAIAALCAATSEAPPASAAPAKPALSAEAAAHQVLGVGFEALGVGVAKTWGLPEELRRALRRPVGTAPAKPLPRGSERNRWLAWVAHEAALAMQSPDVEAGRRRLLQVAERHAGALAVGANDICAAADRARQTVLQLTPAIGLAVPAGSATHRLLHFSSTAALPATAEVFTTPDTAYKTNALGAAALAQLAPAMPAGAAAQACEGAAELLAAGVQDVMHTLASDNFALNAVLRMILESLLRGLHLRRVVFCLRDPRSQLITGRFGMGLDADALASRFVVSTTARAGTPAGPVWCGVPESGGHPYCQRGRSQHPPAPARLVQRRRGRSFISVVAAGHEKCHLWLDLR